MKVEAWIIRLVRGNLTNQSLRTLIYMVGYVDTQTNKLTHATACAGFIVLKCFYDLTVYLS